MATEEQLAELRALLEDYKAGVDRIAERAKDYQGVLDYHYPKGEGRGYLYEAGVVAGWKDAARMAKTMLDARRLARVLKATKSDTKS